MNTLFNQTFSHLKETETDFELYASFDAVPMVCKSKSLFVVLSMEKVRFSTPFPNGNGGVTPFTADFRVSVLTPIASPCQSLVNFFYSVIVPRMQEAGYLLCEMQSDEVKPDYKLQKLVYSGFFRAKGVQVREEESA